MAILPPEKTLTISQDRLSNAREMTRHFQESQESSGVRSGQSIPDGVSAVNMVSGNLLSFFPLSQNFMVGLLVPEGSDKLLTKSRDHRL
jgi:hypothetical protein